MKTSYVNILLFGFLCVAGCQSLEPFFQKPDVAFKTIRIKDMSLHDATAVFYFDVSNPNPMGGTIRGITYDLTVNQTSVARGTTDKGLHIPAKGSETVELPISINYFDIIESATDLLTKKEIAYDLSGSFHLMGFNLPYHTSGKLPLPRLPDIRVNKVKVTDFSWTGANLDFVLEVNNSNAFAVTLSGLEYDISMGGRSFISGTTHNRVTVPQNRSAMMNIPFHINFIWLGKSAYDLLEGESTDYEINGEMIFKGEGFGEKRFPFSKFGNIFLVK